MKLLLLIAMATFSVQSMADCTDLFDEGIENFNQGQQLLMEANSKLDYVIYNASTINKAEGCGLLNVVKNTAEKSERYYDEATRLFNIAIDVCEYDEDVDTAIENKKLSEKEGWLAFTTKNKIPFWEGQLLCGK